MPFAALLTLCCADLCEALAYGCDPWTLAFTLRDAAYALAAYAVVAAREGSGPCAVEGAS